MSSKFQSLTKARRALKYKQPPKGAKLVIVGNGMVSAKFCEELAALGLHKDLEISVIGEESKPAYNRVRLSSYVDTRDYKSLEILPFTWYEEHRISLRTGVRVQEIDRLKKNLHLSDNTSLEYDLLVLATGSRPFVPPIPGSDHPSVFLYRTLEDLDKIITFAAGKTSATVIGGGLLGIEAAQALKSLELETDIIERANFLMPQQLTETAGDLLREKVKAQNIKVHTGIQNTQISANGDALALTLDEKTKIPADMVLISAGISPNSELAETADLPTGVRGGIVVSDDLQTVDPTIFAIGECALLHGRIYGLVAPGNIMAKHLARRLAGRKQRSLAPLDLSTRLKMLGVDVVTIGDPLQEGRRLEFSSDGIYRTLLIGRKRRLIGALAIGPWEENSNVHAAYLDDVKISGKQERYFLEEGIVFPGTKIEDPTQWADSRMVCNCTSTPKKEIIACLTQCQNDPDRVASKTGASTICGSCRPLLEQLCGATPSTTTRKKNVTGLLLASIISLALVGYALAAPPAPMATSVESFWYQIDQLWRDNTLKQISGYTLTAIFTFGLLISMRKRLTWFKWGSFANWRFFHSAFGLTSLGLLWAHTGFHFGANLNWWLMFVFVALNLLGAVSGILAALEAKNTSEKARRFRPLLTKAHILLFWPLPILLTFHILSVYLY
ncbi:MAG: FAD-dependent oxidoreductase [Akkermansiaceae bacterium]